MGNRWGEGVGGKKKRKMEICKVGKSKCFACKSSMSRIKTLKEQLCMLVSLVWELTNRVADTTWIRNGHEITAISSKNQGHDTPISTSMSVLFKGNGKCSMQQSTIKKSTFPN